MLRAPDTPQPADRADQWIVEDELARGASATVYRATRATDGAHGALKVLRPGHDAQSRARFAREADALARLTHPRIPALLDRGSKPDGSPLLVVELIEGRTLADALADAHEEQPLATIIEQLGDALAHAHERGVVHRDVSPRNVVLAGDGAYLVDFGIAQVDAEPDLTATDAILGTLAYAAPEQLAGGACTPASDVFGLAACAFAALTGAPPHAGTTPTEVLAIRLAGGRRELIATDPAGRAVALLIEQALAEDPAQRPADVRAWSTALADAIDAVPLPARRAFAVQTADRTTELRGAAAPPRRWRATAAVGVGVAAAVGVAIAAREPAPPAAALQAGGATVPLSDAWVPIGGGSDGSRRATHRPTGTVVSLTAVDAGSASPSWATQPPTAIRRPGGGELLRWTRGSRTRVVVPSTGRSVIVECSGTASARCAALAAASLVPGAAGASPIADLAQSVRAALRGATPSWRASRTDHRDDGVLDRRAARHAEAADALRGAAAEHAAWQRSPEVRRAAQAFDRSAAAIRRHRTRRTPQTWEALVAADADLRRKLGALGRLVDVPTPGRVRARALPAPSSGRGAPERADSTATPGGDTTTTPSTTQTAPKAAPDAARSPETTGGATDEGTTEEPPIVVGPAL